MRYFLIAAAVTLVCAPTELMAGKRQDRAKEAGIEWSNCAKGKAREFADQSEPAETLATAAMGACTSEAADFRHYFREATREYGLPFARTADQESLDNAYMQIEREIFKMTVTEIIQHRSNRH